MLRTPCCLRTETRLFSAPRTAALEIKGALDDCQTVLDIGCGHSSLLRFLACKRLVGVEGYQPELDQARKAATHDELIRADVRDIDRLFQPGEFDACVAIDVIEHLSQSDGIALLAAMDMLASRKVVVITPNGFLRQSNRDAGDYQEHLSGWKPKDLKARDFDVIGLGGLKILRGEHHQLRFRPIAPWAMISWISQVAWCRNHPEMAAAILGVKRLGVRA